MIELRSVGKSFGAVHAIDGVSLMVQPGELMALVGASGSGKSTLLRMMNRLIEPDRGEVLFQGQAIRGLQPEAVRRRIGYAIQSIGLFPHWTVARNIATVPELLHWPAARIGARVDELLVLLGMDPSQFRNRWPHELSGGQQQRVGVARALAADPDVLLMDEPFGALDPTTRASLQVELARIHRSSGKTIVLVTHDIGEALQLASRVALVDQGRLLQVGTAVQLLTRPASETVRRFFGQADPGLHLLGLQRVSECLRSADAAERVDGEPIADTLSLREALSEFVTRSADRLPVVDAIGRRVGVLHFNDLLRAPPSR